MMRLWLLIKQMPNSALTICSQAGCGVLVRRGRCGKHKRYYRYDAECEPQKTKDRHQRYNRERSESDKFYGTAAWKKLRAYYRAGHPLCEECEKLGLIRAMHVVDHIKPYKLRPDLGLVESNLRSLCRFHHAHVGEKVLSGTDQRGAG